MFESRAGGDEEESKPLTPDVLTYSKLALEAYKKAHDELRTEQSKSPITADEFREYGRHTKLVNKVGVRPAGPEGRYLASFTTTNNYDAGDWRATASSMIFDLRSERLDESYPAREDNWIVGEKDGKYGII